MVAYYFPPLGGIGSLRAARFAALLPEFGWRPTVLAPRHGSYFVDDTIDVAAIEAVRTPSIEPSRLWKRATDAARSDVEPARVGAIGRRLRAMAHGWVYRPDAQVGWMPFAVAAGRRLLRDRRFDAVHSSSFPITAHLVARRLSREAGLPWVAEFRDPWADVKDGGDPLHDYAHRLERALMAGADTVVTVSPTLAARFGGAARRAHVITNGFDPGPSPPRLPATFTITHVGSYYPHMQDLRSVWAAARALREGGTSIVIRIVGGGAGDLVADVKAAGLGAAIEDLGFAPHADALKAMGSSSALVVAGTPRRHPVYDGLLPAKLFEYLGTGRPILYVGDPDTDAGRLLAAQPGSWLVAAGDVGGRRRRAARDPGRPAPFRAGTRAVHAPGAGAEPVPCAGRGGVGAAFSKTIRLNCA